MMHELFGRAAGTCGGKGGSMHIADFSVGMLGANGVVAANIVIAAGAAHALKLQGSDRIVACFFGDGAVNRGPFLEGLNWAQIFELPLLLICENNGYAASTRSVGLTAGDGASARASSLGIPVEDVDGNDVEVVGAAARALVDAVRGGAGPRFLHAHTYRLTGHTGTDTAPYRASEEVESALAAEPLVRCRASLEAAGLTIAELDADRVAAEREMSEAFTRAESAAFPDPARAYEDVQDVGDPRLAAF
jgi:pyruvate dehydrogenase E1 component alpha subunit